MEAYIVFPSFRWNYYIEGYELELYDNAELTNVPKANWNIRIHTSFLDYGLWLPISPFMVIVLNHFQRAHCQYTTHFYLLIRILEDIINTVILGPLSIKYIVSYFYRKCIIVMYMFFKRRNKRHICLSPTSLDMKIVWFTMSEADNKLALSHINKLLLNLMVLYNTLAYHLFSCKLLTLCLRSYTTLKVINKALKHTKPSGMDTFSYLPASRDGLLPTATLIF